VEQQSAPNEALARMHALVGEWAIEASGGVIGDQVMRGWATFEWFDGGHFLIQRSDADHPDVPSAIAVIGCEDGAGSCEMHTFDPGGIKRVYSMRIEDGVRRVWGDAPGFFQRFTGTFNEDGSAIPGSSEFSEDGTNWRHDFDLLYAKAG
jgi:hypothetical protein